MRLRSALRMTGLLLVCVSLACQRTRTDLEANEEAGSFVRADLTQALADVLEGKRELEKVRIKLESVDPSPTEDGTVKVYGNGFGIWNGQTQFTLRREQILDLLKQFQASEFTRQPLILGDSGPFIGLHACGVLHIFLTIDGETRASSLYVRGDRDSFVQPRQGNACVRFAELGLAIRKASAEAAEHGVTAADVEDGLGKIQKKELIPESMILSVSDGILDPNAPVQPENSEPNVSRECKPGPVPEGWSVTLRGRVVEARHSSAGKGDGAPCTLELTAAELDEIVRGILDAKAWNFRAKVAKLAYDKPYRVGWFRITVLDRGSQLEIGATSVVAPESKESVERVFHMVHQLNERVLKEGRTAKPEVLLLD